MEQETQQHEGHTSTGSLPHRRVLSKSDTSPGKRQVPYQKVEQFLQIIDLIKPHTLWIILVVIAIYDYFRTWNVIEFLILMAAAAGYISLPRAIDFLLGRSSPLLEEMEADAQPRDKATGDQDEPV